MESQVSVSVSVAQAMRRNEPSSSSSLHELRERDGVLRNVGREVCVLEEDVADLRKKRTQAQVSSA